jgi:large subunit ribosomal protein L30e
MAKKTVDKTIEEIRKLLKDNEVVLGTERTLKELKTGKIEKVYLSDNAPEEVRADLNKYGKLNDVEIVNLKFSNEELGEICKKPFLISVIGKIKK